MQRRDLQILLGLVEFEVEWWEGGRGEFTFEELEALRVSLSAQLEGSSGEQGRDPIDWLNQEELE